LAWLQPRYPALDWPAVSTAGDLLARRGLVKKRRRRRHYQHPGVVPVTTTQPNDLWTADFKGHFRTRDRIYCYPLTVADQHTRYLLACHGLLSTKGVGVRPIFDRLFREYGLPRAIRTDNGVPFATTGIHGLSQLNVWWLRLGIQHQRILPAHPEQNGAHERMHKTLKGEACRPPQSCQARQQRAFNAFRRLYNDERPHEALRDRPPAALYHPSPRPYTGTLPFPRQARHQCRDDSAEEAAALPLECASTAPSGSRGSGRWDLVDSLLPRPARTRGRTRLRNPRLAVNCHPCCRSILLPMFPVAHGQTEQEVSR
jgi:putative transposase